MRGFLFLLLFLLGCGSESTSYESRSSQSYVNVYFSKNSGEYSGGVDELIIKDIKEAKKSVKLAVYELTNSKITDALIEADKRVKVEVIVDDGYYGLEEIKRLISNGVDVKRDNTSYTMHNKYLVIDDKIVWSGSGNYTYYAFYRNYENFVRVEGDEAEVYSKDFDMIRDKNLSYIATKTIYFSPNDNVKSVILNKINSAKRRLYFLMYAFTDKDIADALIKAKRRGVEVRGVVDLDEAKSDYSVYGYLVSNGIDVREDTSSYKLHDKVLIADDEVITGSYNYTLSANSDNFENVIIINKYLPYQEEFERIYSESK